MNKVDRIYKYSYTVHKSSGDICGKKGELNEMINGIIERFGELKKCGDCPKCEHIGDYVLADTPPCKIWSGNAPTKRGVKCGVANDILNLESNDRSVDCPLEFKEII